jgi:hypothetical protein
LRRLASRFIAGLFVTITLPLSCSDILGHLNHYQDPDRQKWVVRVLWMCPVYAVESWLSLRFKESALYITPLRDIYEAFVVYSFYRLISEVAVLHKEAALSEVVAAAHAPDASGKHGGAKFARICCMCNLEYDQCARCRGR